MNKLKSHPFFSNFSYDTKWGNLLNQQSPLQAKVKLCSRPKLSDDEVNKIEKKILFNIIKIFFPPPPYHTENVMR